MWWVAETGGIERPGSASASRIREKPLLVTMVEDSW